MPDKPTIREQWQAYAKGACEWCAVHLGHTGSDDAKATGVLPQSAPNFVHKVYPPLVNTPLSQYLRCTAMTFEAWAEWRIERLTEALKRNRQGYLNILEMRKLTSEKWGSRDGYGGRYGALTREEVEQVIAEIDVALAAQPESGVTNAS